MCIPVNLERWQPWLPGITTMRTAVQEDIDLMGASLENGKVLRYLLAGVDSTRRVSLLTDLLTKGDSRALMDLAGEMTGNALFTYSSGPAEPLKNIVVDQLTKIVSGIKSAQNIRTAQDAQKLFFQQIRTTFGSKSPFARADVKTWEDFERFLKEKANWLLSKIDYFLRPAGKPLHKFLLKPPSLRNSSRPRKLSASGPVFSR